MLQFMLKTVCALAPLVLAPPTVGASPESPPAPLTVKAAVDLSTRNFPAIQESLAVVAAAESGISLAKTAYLPSAAMRLGVNFATRNNVFGLTFPNGVLPGISGPVQEESTITSVFGSSAGVLLSYEPFDLGLRRASVREAEAVKARAQAGRELTVFEVSLATAETYLLAVANQRAVLAAKASVERMQLFHESVLALVASELRPGADGSRSKAELARSQSDLVRAEREEQTALASLAEWLGLAGSAVEINPASLLSGPPPGESPNRPLDRHPLATVQQAEISVGQARLEVLEKEWRPRFEAQSAVYGRGTGARIDGTFHGRGYGLAPRVGNWAVGFNINFDLLDYKRNRASRQIEAHRIDQQRAREETVTQELRAQVARARIAIEAARKIAMNTPIELEAAKELAAQSQARYQAGLGTVVEVADAQRLLRQAEVDDSLANLGVWRALLSLSAALGEISQFLMAASR